MHVALVLHVVRKAGGEAVLAVPQCVPIIPGASGIPHYLITLLVSLYPAHRDSIHPRSTWKGVLRSSLFGGCAIRGGSLLLVP